MDNIRSRDTAAFAPSLSKIIAGMNGQDMIKKRTASGIVIFHPFPGDIAIAQPAINQRIKPIQLQKFRSQGGSMSGWESS